MKTARVISDAGWWIFVVSALFSLAASPTASGPSRYADYGWSAYPPMRDGFSVLRDASEVAGDSFTATNTFSTIALVAIVIVVIAAHVEGFLSRDWVRAALVVVATVGGGALVLIAMTGGIGAAQFNWPVLYALVLLGVAVREIATRRLPIATRSAPQRPEGVDQA